MKFETYVSNYLRKHQIKKYFYVRLSKAAKAKNGFFRFLPKMLKRISRLRKLYLRNLNSDRSETSFFEVFNHVLPRKHIFNVKFCFLKNSKFFVRGSSINTKFSIFKTLQLLNKTNWLKMVMKFVIYASNSVRKHLIQKYFIARLR